jgi:hypothetical protein
MKGDTIIIDVGADGSVKADVVKGPGGAGCVKELLALLAGTGVTEANVTKKREYHQKVVVSQKAKVGQ